MINSSINKHIPIVDKSSWMTPSAENCRIIKIKSGPDVFHTNFFWIFHILNCPVNIQAPHITSSFLILHLSSRNVSSSYVIVHLSSHKCSWSRNYTSNIAMLSPMYIAWIHDLLPFSLNDVINPQISKYFSIRPLSSKHHKVVVITKHHMSSSWRRSLSKVLHFLPRVGCILILIKIIQVVLLISHKVPSSKDPDSVNWVLAWSMIFSRHKPFRRRFNTDDTKSLNRIKSSFNHSWKVTNFVLNFELDGTVVSHLTEVIDDKPIPGLVIRTLC